MANICAIEPRPGALRWSGGATRQLSSKPRRVLEGDLQFRRPCGASHAQGKANRQGRNFVWLAMALALAGHGALFVLLAMMPPQRVSFDASIYPLTVQVPLVARIQPPAETDHDARFAVEIDDAIRDAPLVGMSTLPPDVPYQPLPMGETLMPSPKALIGLTTFTPGVDVSVLVAGNSFSGGVSGQGQDEGRYGVPNGGAADGNIGVLARPDYLRNPPPKYPPVARQNGWQGRAILRVEVLASGSAGQIELLQSSGHRVLDEASIETVRIWKFMPARVGGGPVDSWVEVPINFRLGRS